MSRNYKETWMLKQESDGLWGLWFNGAKIGLFGSREEALSAYPQLKSLKWGAA